MLLSLSAANVFAQSSLIATLSHEGEITAFYGANALKEAHEAAAHGDAITLSSGTFNATDITKAITLRGAGMQVDTVYNTLPTIILGDFTINIAEDITQKLVIEGIYSDNKITIDGKLLNPRFFRNRFNEIATATSCSGIIDAYVLHCKITQTFYNAPSESHISFVGSYVHHPQVYNGSRMSFINCVIDYIHCAHLEKCSFSNSILVGDGNFNYSWLEESVTAYNCIAINCFRTVFDKISNTTNVESSFDELFKDFTGTYNDNITFELTDEAKAKFLGTDDTQVGIYGGNFPYDPTTTNPHITKCNVAAKSTADGKLSVDIEVAGVE